MNVSIETRNGRFFVSEQKEGTSMGNRRETIRFVFATCAMQDAWQAALDSVSINSFDK